MDKVKKTKRNIVYGFINKIILMIFPFIIRSIIIWKLGVDYVGLNSLFSSILQVLSLAELGFGTAIVYGMYKPIAENDVNQVCALLNFYRKIYVVIGAVILVAGLAILPLLPSLISGGYPNDINIYSLYLIYLANTVSSYFLFAYKQSILLANQRVDIDNIISTIIHSVMYVLQIISLIITKNYYCYIIILPISTVLINIIRNYIVTKKFPQYKCIGELSKATKKDMYKRVYGLTLTKICQVCRNSFDSIVISSFVGLTVLGRYQNYYYVINTIISFMYIITTSLVAGIGNSVATRNIDDNYGEFKLFHFGYSWLTSWCTVCLLCLYQPFMKIWVGLDNMFPLVLVILMCIYFYALKVGDVVSVYKEATGIYWEDRHRPIIESVANLILNFALVKLLGVYGVVIATIISIALINIPWSIAVLFKHYFSRSSREYYLSIYKNCLVTIFACAVTYMICNLISIEGILGLAIRFIMCLIIPNVIMYYLNRKNPLLTSLKQIINKFIHSKNNEE